MTLDEEISDAFGLLAVLLVFVIAYFSAILPQADELIDRPRPSDDSTLRSLIAGLGAYRKLTAGFLVLVCMVAVVLWPLTSRVLRSTSWEWPVPTLRAGLILVDMCLVGLAAGGIRLVQRLSARITKLKEPLVLPLPAK